MSTCYILAIFAFVFAFAHIITVLSIKDVKTPKQLLFNVSINCCSMIVSAGLAIGILYGFSTYIRFVGLPYVCEQFP